MAAWTMPNYNNTNRATHLQGVMHMPTQFKSAGKSLTPLQRSGVVPNAGMPVMAAAGVHGLENSHVAPPSRVTTPPIVAYAGSVSHTGMWQYHV